MPRPPAPHGSRLRGLRPASWARRTVALSAAVVLPLTLTSTASATTRPGPSALSVSSTPRAGAAAVPAGPVPRLTTVRPAAPGPAAARRAADALGRRVTTALLAGGGRVVGAAVDVDGLGPVLRRSATTALPPASTQKSFVAATALMSLPADSVLTTEVAATATVGSPGPGRLPGDLYLVAGGDPYLTRSGLDQLARAVHARGLTAVSGDLVLDDSRYDAVRAGRGWKPGWTPDEAGPLSAFALDANQWRADRAFLADPALPDTEAFRAALRAAGVRVDGRVRRGSRPAEAATLAVQRSLPLARLVARLLQDSDNFAAELLLKEVGHALRGDGSSAGGLLAVRQVLGALGVPVGPVVDGSGLSGYDRQTPAGALALLRAVDASGAAGLFRAALPVACGSGTLRERMCGTAAAGRVSAKTGTLDGVRALAGFTTTASGRRVRFVFQIVGAPDGLRARAALDRAATVLAAARE